MKCPLKLFNNIGFAWSAAILAALPMNVLPHIKGNISLYAGMQMRSSSAGDTQ